MRKRIANYGPVYDPLPVDWSAYKIPGWDQDALNLKIKQRVAKSRMRRFRSVPVMRKIWYVTLIASTVCVSDFARWELSASLSFDPQAFWCLSQRKARALVSSDHDAGGQGTMFPVEYRRCPVCGRLLLGSAARDYLVKQFQPKKEWHFENGPACSMDCKPGRKYKKRGEKTA